MSRQAYIKQEIVNKKNALDRKNEHFKEVFEKYTNPNLRYNSAEFFQIKNELVRVEMQINILKNEIEELLILL